MKNFTLLHRFFLACILCITAFISRAQTYDTICDWDNYFRDWYVSSSGSMVNNPAPDTVNPSPNCFKFVTSNDQYEFMICELDEEANFNLCPVYKMKVLAPVTGGNITLKFENHNNSFSQEIMLTPVPGQWTDLVYDFTGHPYNGLIKMTIFPDIQSTSPGKNWYIDDIMKEPCEDPVPLELESNLPIIVINTFGEPIPDEPKITAHMGVIDNGPGELNHLDDPFNHYDNYIGIETRGQSSQMFPKKSFAVETRDSTGEDMNLELLGLPSENDWVLYAPYSDKSMLRNIMSFEMGRKMGNYCTRSVFCEVVINDDYQGVYTLMEKIKQDDNRVDIAGLKPDEVSGDDLTGGYIIKVDKLDWDFEYYYDGWKSDPTPGYPNAMDIIFQYYQPGPDEIVSQQREYIKNYVTEAENTLTLYYFANPYIGYQQYLDVPSFIDALLLSEIPKEVDKYRYSTYFYKEKNTDGGKLFAGPAWDFDLGYGNVDYWQPGLQYTGWLYTTVEPVDWSIMFWWKRLMEDQYFKDMTRTRWNWLRQERLSDAAIHQMIDSIIVLTADARERNFERWPILGQYVWPNYDWFGNTYEDEVNYFEGYLFNRLAWMDANLPGNVIEPKAGISAINDKIDVVLYDDYFRRPILEKEMFTLNNAPSNLFIQSVDYISASSCRLVLNADMTDYPDVSVTIDKKALNYWLDITSSPLSAAGTSEITPNKAVFKIYNENKRLHLYCNAPKNLLGRAEIFNSAGQKIMSFSLQKQSENIIEHQLNTGLYLLVIETKESMKVFKFTVSGL